MEKIFDVFVIGGGIQGAGVARDASLRGLSVGLAEQFDFASGTSSNSSKLIHGGLRYLERLEFLLVHESLQERSILLETAKHLVHPLSFTIPIFRKARRPGWIFQAGLILYDGLAGKRGLFKHQSISSEKVLQKFPFLSAKDLKRGLEYFDGQMDDARMVISNLRDAQDHGALCMNYTKVERCDPTPEGGFHVVLRNSKGEQSLKAKTLVNASGPWVDDCLKRMNVVDVPKVSQAKGIHLVFDCPFPIQGAALLEVPQDDRIFFILPWKNKLLVGTTDTPFSKDPHEAQTEETDFQYLWDCLKKYFTPSFLSQLKLTGTMVGIRPLVFKKGSQTKETSRGYKLFQNPKKVWNVVGGKYTVYRKISEKIVDEICETLSVSTPCRTKTQALPGSPKENWEEFKKTEISRCQKDLSIDLPRATNLLNRYGNEWEKVGKLAQNDSTLLSPLFPESSYLGVDVLFAIQNEFVQTLEDFMVRRTDLFYSSEGGTQGLNRIGEFFSHSEEQKKSYREKIQTLTLRNKLFVTNVGLPGTKKNGER